MTTEELQQALEQAQHTLANRAYYQPEAIFLATALLALFEDRDCELEPVSRDALEGHRIMTNTVNTTNIPTDLAYILGQVAGMYVRNDDTRPVIAEMRRQGIVKNGLAGWATLTRKGQFALFAASRLANQKAGL